MRTCTLGVSITMVSLACTETGDRVVVGAGSVASDGWLDNASATAQKASGKAFKQYSGWGSRVARVIRCRAQDRWRVVAAGIADGMRGPGKRCPAERE